MSIRFLGFALDRCHTDIISTRHSLHYNLSALLPICVGSDSISILKFFEIKNLQLKKNCVEKYSKKLNFLLSKQSKCAKSIREVKPPKSWVTNLSSRILTKEELDILALGENFAIKQKPDNLYVLGYLESSLKCVPVGSAAKIRSFVSNFLNNNKYKPCVNYKKKMSLIKSLNNDKSIVIVKADKSNSTVIMNTEDYNKKMDAILSDSHKFKVLEEDITSSIQNKINGTASSLFKEKLINKDMSSSIRSYTAVLPPIYGCPKTHKDNVPLRPIVNFKRSPLANMASYIAKTLKIIMEDSPYSSNSTYDVLKKLKLLTPPGDFIMVSLDVTSLFTSIPIGFALECVKKFLDDLSPSIAATLPCSTETLLDLIEYNLRNNVFGFKEKVYLQLDGAPMGSPLSCIIAEIVMRSFDVLIVQQFPLHMFYFIRYLDDIFSVIHPDYANSILQFANSIHPSIQFTIENESPIGSLPFLDLFITRNVSGTFQYLSFNVYRKPMHSGRYVNFFSNVPISHKKAVISSLCKRAISYCSNDENFKTELLIIKKDLLLNQYPITFIRKWMFNYTHPSPPSPIDNNSETSNNSFIKLPYVTGLSEALAKFCYRLNVKIVSFSLSKIGKFLLKPYPPPSYLDKLGVIYKIPCGGCNLVYIGETTRTLTIRMKEHQLNLKNKDIRSRLVTHAMECCHSPDWSRSEVLLTGCPDVTFQKFAEGIFSEKLKTVVNEYAKVPEQYKCLLSI